MRSSSSSYAQGAQDETSLPRQEEGQPTKESATATDSELQRMPWPEADSGRRWLLIGLYERWTYSYMRRILKKGSQQAFDDGTHLCKEDLYFVPPSMETSNLHQKFRESYTTETSRSKKSPIFWALWHVMKRWFVPAGLCQLVSVVAQVSIPLSVRQLLAVLEDNPNQKVLQEALGYALLIFLASILNAFAYHRQRHLATKSGVVIRTAIMSTIYQHALGLTPMGRTGLTTGEVTNLVAIDAQKLFEVTQEGHLIWSCPLSMIMVAILLLWIMGPTTIVGMAVLFAFVPMVQKIASRMLAIRHERIKVSDERIETISGMLQGIKVTKLNNYEFKYQKRIEEIREREMALLRRELFVWAWTLVVTVSSPVIASAATFTTYVLVNENNILTASKTFTVLLLFAALRFPINLCGKLIGKAAQALEAAHRINAFLQREARDPQGDLKKEGALCAPTDGGGATSSPPLTVKDGTFQLLEKSKTMGESLERTEMSSSGHGGFELSKVDLSLNRNEILAVVGPVGSGKSVLLNGILGEIALAPHSEVLIKGKVGVAHQTPFILNDTLRSNILFGIPYEKDRYEMTLDACCLRQDIEQLGAAGDMTEIGERGVTLSGGQKQRVSLARVAYSRPDLAIFDDPLSALDAETSKKIFERLFEGAGNNLLSSSSIVLVTHASNFLSRVSKILVLTSGKVGFLGSWDELTRFEPSDAGVASAVNAIKSSLVDRGGESLESTDEKNDGGGMKSEVSKDSNKHGSDPLSNGELMTVEKREHGRSNLKTWLIWFKYAGGISFLTIQIIFMSIDRFAYVGTEWWLARWTEGSDQPIRQFGTSFAAQTEGRSAQYDYLKVYAAILLVSFFSTSLRSQWAVSGGARSAKGLFSTMTTNVLLAPMSYFETTPLGRILNRFTHDVEVVDITLAEQMSVLMIATSWGVAGVVLMTTILPWIISALVPIMIIYGFLQNYYRKSGADLQRLDAVSRSPLQALLAEGLDGASTIRVFDQTRNFLRKFQHASDENSAALLNFITAQRWLGIRTELLGAIVQLVASVLVVSFNDILNLETGIVALLIIWSSNFTITLNFLVDSIAESEAAITSVERIHDLSFIPREKDMNTSKSNQVPSSWPEHGELVFENVCLRYRSGLPLALNCLSFRIASGQRCGVVGRTGAGKSSLTAALFRLVEIESGQIMLDGVDLASLGLSDVRGRPNGLAIIPQDPVLYPGSLRDSLDPFGTSTDPEIVEALAAVRMSDERGELALNDVVQEGGANYSVGERQLLCLARALLSKPKLLVMDEATASVDGETDNFIQQMLRTRFSNTTVLSIAHRLETIIDYDVILVMDGGRAAECGSPKALLAKPDGAFLQLVNSMGEERSAALKNMLKNAM